MQGAIDPIGSRRHLAAPIDRAAAGKQEPDTAGVNGVDPAIRRDERTKHLDKLNVERTGMRLRHRRLSIIRRRDNAAHNDQ